MDEDLYKGVNTASPPSHAQLIAQWVRPDPPPGYRNLVALLVTVKVDGRERKEWMLDYLDTERSAFASDEQEVTVPWPWVEGFLPQASDWDAIGIPHLI